MSDARGYQLLISFALKFRLLKHLRGAIYSHQALRATEKDYSAHCIFSLWFVSYRPICARNNRVRADELEFMYGNVHMTPGFLFYRFQHSISQICYCITIRIRNDVWMLQASINCYTIIRICILLGLSLGNRNEGITGYLPYDSPQVSYWIAWSIIKQ